MVRKSYSSTADCFFCNFSGVSRDFIINDGRLFEGGTERLTMGNHECGLTDAEIARRIVEGDFDAFEEVLKKCQGRVLSIIKKHVPYGQVEDVAQDVFIRIFKSLPPPGFGYLIDHSVSSARRWGR